MLPIFEAIAKNDANKLAKIISEEAAVDVVDGDDRTPLMHASIDGRDQIVPLLINANCSLNSKDKAGYTALHFAAQNFHLNIAKILLESGVSVDPQDMHGNTPLWRATFNSKGKGEMIKLLLSYGADKNLKNSSGKAPIDLAKTIANYDLAQFF
jgi:uncharacterized protein